MSFNTKNISESPREKLTAGTELLRARAEDYSVDGEMKYFRLAHQQRLKAIENQRRSLQLNRHEVMT